jgi:hypothetical protein
VIVFLCLQNAPAERKRRPKANSRGKMNFGWSNEPVSGWLVADACRFHSCIFVTLPFWADPLKKLEST